MMRFSMLMLRGIFLITWGGKLKKVIINLTDKIRIFGDIPDEAKSQIMDRLIFNNPKYETAVKYGHDRRDIPRILSFYSKKDDAVEIPRGFASQLLEILNYFRIPFTMVNECKKQDEVVFNFNGKLYEYQRIAVLEMLKKNFGVLQAPTGSGKTIMALKIIAERKQPCLVVVHSKELLYQWQDRISQFFDVPAYHVGLIGDGKKFDKCLKIHVGIVNSVAIHAEKIKPYIGHLVIDECHRVPSTTFQNVAAKFDSLYSLGLSATPFRKDKLTKLIWLFVGDKRHEINTSALQENKFIIRPRLKVRHTNFNFDYQDNYVEMIGGLVLDVARLNLVLKAIEKHAKSSTWSGISLVVSDRKSHCLALFDGLQKLGIETRLLTGSTLAHTRRQIVEEMGRGVVKVVIATSQLVGEGFDSKQIDTLFLTVPISFEGRLLQMVGRAVRTAEGKTEAVIYDFVDSSVGVLEASFKKRLRVYESIGVSVEGLI